MVCWSLIGAGRDVGVRWGGAGGEMMGWVGNEGSSVRLEVRRVWCWRGVAGGGRSVGVEVGGMGSVATIFLLAYPNPINVYTVCSNDEINANTI